MRAGSDCAPPLELARIIRGNVPPSDARRVARQLHRCGGCDMKIVLVVDDEEVREALSAALRDQYFVYTAENADEALDIMKRTHVDALVTELRLPDRTGLDLAEIVRRNYPHIAIAVISEYVPEPIEHRLWMIGCARCLRKPVDIGILREALREMLGLAQPAPERPVAT